MQVTDRICSIFWVSPFLHSTPTIQPNLKRAISSAHHDRCVPSSNSPLFLLLCRLLPIYCCIASPSRAGLGSSLSTSPDTPRAWLSSAMSLFRDSTIVRSQCNAKSGSTCDSPSTQAHSPRPSLSIPSLSATIRNSLNWAGETIQAFHDGPPKEERNEQMDVEDRKKALYLRMHNVSTFSFLCVPEEFTDQITPLGSILRGVADVCLRTRRTRE